MDILPGARAIGAAVSGATICRVGQRISLRDVSMVARATHSSRARVSFIQFCL
jgi:hypothetical protein